MNILQRIFRKRGSPQALITVENTFASFAGTPYANVIYRGGVDAIARHVGKLKASTPSKRLHTLLNIRPNPYMGPYDLLYKLCTAYYVHGNAFLLLDRDPEGKLSSIYPLVPSSVEFLPGEDSLLYARCTFKDGSTATFQYSDVIHMRRHFLHDDLLGDGPVPIVPTLDTAETMTQGLKNATKSGTGIRGILKFANVTSPDKQKEERNAFVRDYLGMDNAGGIAALDKAVEFQALDMKPYTIPREQMDAVKEQVYGFLGINDRVVSGCFTEDEFSAFYESVIEPFALALSQEITAKTGAEVSFTGERMEFSSAGTKIKLLHEAAPLGVMTVDEARHLLALPPVEDGEERLQSLNYIKAKDASEYQLGKEEGEEDGETDGTKE